MNKAYILNVFTGEHAQGNPAAVVKLTAWLADTELQALSKNLGQPVTSFIVATDQGYAIRWFAGDVEIDLCGHGSLAAAAAAAIFEIQPEHALDVKLHSQHGIITVKKLADGYSMVMPSWTAKLSLDLHTNDYGKLVGLDPIDVFATRDLILVLEDEHQVRDFKPDFAVIKAIDDYHALIVTAQKGEAGYVLRFFAPKIGIDEDIATGSAQCSLVPYWSNKLSVDQLDTRQLEVHQRSREGGYFQVTQNQNDSIELKVNVVLKDIVNLGEL
ncbi:PhzF family phenazine biosynthesis protein [Moritella marina ATCC 15381]|uniref:PhzF family phenazine biosynthesis protein n=1 Tax=Moritella marina ATCC 15381 TaxID=1202962 RepID=A0A5J6WI18_MORMI|nr:PhzF family phenazine biosynthesis protein [Moritella marina]QFI37789.1 PhzF family phenazine biosynthesis protein [Moritella marina ATCC 15381]